MSGIPAIDDVGYFSIPVQAEDWSPTVSDGSEAMFSMYLERSDEDDTKTTERWKAESDAILIFVSNCNLLSPWFHVNTRWYRLVFSRPPSRLFFHFLSRTFGRVLRTPLHFISRIFTTYSQIPLPPSRSSFPRPPIHLNFLRLDTRLWLTHFGS
jgi:hypothetical protein